MIWTSFKLFRVDEMKVKIFGKKDDGITETKVKRRLRAYSVVLVSHANISTAFFC